MAPARKPYVGDLNRCITPSDTELEWLGEGLLYKSISNKRQGVQTASTIPSYFQAIIEASLELLFRYGTHQTKMGDLNRYIFDLTQDWNGLWKGHYLSWI